MSRPSSRWLIPIFLIWSTCVFPQEESVESRIAVAGLKSEEVRGFLSSLQAGIAQHDSKSICAMAIDPLPTRVPGRVRTVDICRRNYAQIFNVRVVNAVRNQKFERLFANDKGVMLGNGEVWIAGVCRDAGCAKYDLRIITVNN